jgi:Raf kinase inhibitor-like YbhB/YbcL family protein
MLYRYSGLIAVLTLIVSLGCWNEAQAADANSFQLQSSVFAANGDIPAKFTCDGKNVSPPLAWTGAPDGTKSYALIVDDPDAPKTHWVMYNMPVRFTQMPDATSPPPNAKEGLNDWKAKGYKGPCPSAGKHQYVFTVYALDTALKLSGPPTKAQLETAMQGHVLGQAPLTGMYQKSKTAAATKAAKSIQNASRPAN